MASEVPTDITIDNINSFHTRQRQGRIEPTIFTWVTCVDRYIIIIGI